MGVRDTDEPGDSYAKHSASHKKEKQTVIKFSRTNRVR